MGLVFPFERERSSVFGWVHRPYAVVSFWSFKYHNWLKVAMIVDSGADYTMLPKQYLPELGIHPQKDTRKVTTSGVGGSTAVSLVQKNYRVKLGSWERNIPIGFIDSEDMPPLLGRQGFLETFRVTFHNHRTEFLVA